MCVCNLGEMQLDRLHIYSLTHSFHCRYKMLSNTAGLAVFSFSVLILYSKTFAVQLQAASKQANLLAFLLFYFAAKGH